MVENVCHYSHLDLSNVIIIAAQHLQPTTWKMVNSWIRFGLEPENCHLIGKCYSTDPLTVARLRENGVKVASSSESYNSHQTFDDNYQQQIELFVKTTLDEISTNSTCRRIIVLDDGGYLLGSICNQISSFAQPVVGIEQTTSGFDALARHDLPFPIINVARSWAKLRLEPSLIARKARICLHRSLEHQIATVCKALIIGHGVIGRAIQNSLPAHWQVDAFDRLSATARSPSDMGQFCRAGEYDIIFGCTGNTILHGMALVDSERTIQLASLSSSDREFDATSLRRLAPPSTDCHKNITIGSTTLLNSGFPINFLADPALNDSEEFELTRSLLTGAVCQAMSVVPGGETGLIDLNNPIQHFIALQYLSDYQTSKSASKALA